MNSGKINYGSYIEIQSKNHCQSLCTKVYALLKYNLSNTWYSLCLLYVKSNGIFNIKYVNNLLYVIQNFWKNGYRKYICKMWIKIMPNFKLTYIRYNLWAWKGKGNALGFSLHSIYFLRSLGLTGLKYAERWRNLSIRSNCSLLAYFPF